MKPICATAILLLALLPLVGNAETTKYGQKFSFKPGQNFEFTDFRLEFIDRKLGPFSPGSTTHRLGDIFEFQVVSAAGSQTIYWSTGTGDIGPTTFRIRHKCFWLELLRSDDFGKLGENQAVASHRSKSEDCGQEEAR